MYANMEHCLSGERLRKDLLTEIGTVQTIDGNIGTVELESGEIVDVRFIEE